jgi:hypothetical protein
MDRKVWWPAIVACLILVGCVAGPEPRDGKASGGHARFNDQHCPADAAVCQIDVRVDCTPSPCIAVVDPKVLLIFRDQASRPKKINWHLKGEPGYLFADEEVKLDSSEFMCERPDASRKLLVCTDNFTHPQPNVYPYELKVVKESGGPALTVDPWIVPK